MPVARALWYGQLKGNSLNAHTRLLVQECLGGNAGQNWMQAPVYITNPTTKVAYYLISKYGAP